MAAVGVDSLQGLFSLEELVDRACGCHDLADAGIFKVAVMEWCIDENRTWSNGTDHFMEIKGDAVGIVAVGFAHAWHVTVLGPGCEFSLVVMVKGGKATTGNSSSNPGFKGGGEEGVVSTERMANAADAAWRYLGHGLQEVNGSHVVPDRFHGATDIGFTGAVEIIRVITEAWIVGSQADVATFGQLVRVMQSRFAADASRLALADSGCLVQAQHGSGWLLSLVRDEQVGRDVITAFGLVGNFSSQVFFGPGFFQDLDVQGAAAIRAG